MLRMENQILASSIFRFISFSPSTEMRASYTLPLAAFAAPVLGKAHYFFSGFFAGETIVGVEFDDVISSLTLMHNITTQASSGSKWIAIDVG